MPGPRLSRTPRTVLGVLVDRVPAVSSTHGSCPWSGYAGAVFLTPWGTRGGLGGPMPASIALVLAGRCRPSPDRVSEGASSDRHGGSLVASGLACGRGEWDLPVFGAPPARVGGIDDDHTDAGLCAHRQQSGAEFACGDAGDELPEPLLATVLLPGLGVGEVQVFDRDGLHARGLGPVQQASEGVADLCVTAGGGAGEVVIEAARCADRVSVLVELPCGEVVGVHVDTDHALRSQGGEGNDRQALAGPGRVQVPAAFGHVQVDAVSDSPVVLNTVAPFVTPVREAHLRGEDVPAVPGVCQVGERCAA